MAVLDIGVLPVWLGALAGFSVSLQDFRLTHYVEVFGVAYGLTDQGRGDMGLHQRLKRVCLVEAGIQPEIKVLGPEHEGDAFGMDMAETGMRRERDHREGVHLLVAEMPGLP